MDITLNAHELQAVCTTIAGQQRALTFLAPLNVQMAKYGINTAKRAACFLAQILHESGEFHFLTELASGEEYNGRKDLGNTEPGDGPRFKGRGLIQITGRANYALCGKALGEDLIAHPERLATTELATASACWFWSIHHLNDAADEGDFLHITQVINGGREGLSDRLMYLARARKALGTT